MTATSSWVKFTHCILYYAQAVQFVAFSDQNICLVAFPKAPQERTPVVHF